jgi:signal transduction histidine kinase
MIEEIYDIKIFNRLHYLFLKKSRYNLIISHLVGVASYLLCVAVERSLNDYKLLLLFLVHTLIAISRTFFSFKFFKNFSIENDGLENVKKREFQQRILSVHILLMGCMWGIIVYYVLTKYGLHNSIFSITIMIAAGTCAIAVGTIGFLSKIYYSYSAILLGSAALGIFVNLKIEIALAFNLAILIYYFTLISLQKSSYKDTFGHLYHQIKSQESSNLLTAIFDTLSADVMLIDRYGRIKFYNGHYLTSLNLKPENINLKKFEEVELDIYFQNCLNEFRSWPLVEYSTELNLMRNENTRWHSVNLVKIQNGEIVILCFDIQDLKNALFEIEMQKKMVLQNARMASIGEMSGGIAHEINNPLTVINLGVKQLKKKLLDSEHGIDSLASSIEKIENNINRISSIIKTLKLVSRESLSDLMKIENANDLVDDCSHLIRERAQTLGVAFHVSKSAENLNIECSKVQIEQVLINILNNAFDAIELSDSPWIKIKISRELNFAFIKISNSGQRISAEVIDKIMVPFFTTKEPGKGTGLGLSISTTIIEQHNGKLFVDLEEEFTTFVIKLPRKELLNS